jgi:hypothetical protein
MASASRARRYCSESSRIAHTQVLHFSFGLDGCVAPRLSAIVFQDLRRERPRHRDGGAAPCSGRHIRPPWGLCVMKCTAPLRPCSTISKCRCALG